MPRALDTAAGRRLPFMVGEWTVEPSLNLVAKDGLAVHLRPRVMDLLVCLASHGPQVVPKQQLLDEVWGTEFVSESALTTALTELRHALADGDEAALVETVPKRGYRLVVPVRWPGAATIPIASPDSPGPPTSPPPVAPPADQGPPLAAGDPIARRAFDAEEGQRRPDLHGDQPVRAPARRSARFLAACVVAGVLVGVPAGVLIAPALRPHPAPTRALARVELGVSPADELQANGFRSRVATRGGSRTALAWTPDGATLVFVGRAGGRQRLYARRLDRADAVALEGTDDAQAPAVSPDGRWIVFWANGALRRVPAEGGLAHTLLSPVEIVPSGIAIGVTGRVVFSVADPPGDAFRETIWEIGPGPAARRVTSLRAGEMAHLLPQLLAGDDVLLYTARRAGTWGDERIVAERTTTGERRELLRDAADARYLASGHLAFLRRGLLMAAPFDAARLAVTGEPVALVDGVAQALTSGNQFDITGAGQFSVSSTGALAYVPSPVVEPPDAELVAVSRTGAVTVLPFGIRKYSGAVDLSPDGRRIAVPVGDLSVSELWIADLVRGSMTRLAARGEPDWVRWTPDGTRVTFSSLFEAQWEVAWQPADGGAPAQRLAADQWYVSSWSPDGRRLAAIKDGDIWLLAPGAPHGEATRVTDTPRGYQSPEFSPDGRWLAYASSRNGRLEVYLRPYPGPGPEIQVSIAGGTTPAWNRRGDELYFVEPGEGSATPRRMMAVAIRDGRPGIPHALGLPADLVPRCAPNRCYAVSPDGQRFYMTRSLPTPPQEPVTRLSLVLGWTGQLEDGK